MKGGALFVLSIHAFALACFNFSPPARAQDTGMSLGIPNSSPGVNWPRSFSLETQSPNVLYPNGPQFGLSNTSGGFGTSGTGPMSGVGLEQRTVSLLVRQEMNNPYAFNNRLVDEFGRELSRSSSILGSVLAGRFRAQMRAPEFSDYQPGSSGLIAPSALPSVDSILQDRPASTESILRNGL